MRPSSIVSLTPITGNLNKPTQVASSQVLDSTFFMPSTATFMFHVYLFPTERTKTLSTDPVTTQTIFTFGNALQLGIQAPNASSDAPKATLKIQQSSADFYEQSFQHPPVQKWTLVSIVRQGRRFTVYYDKTVVASFRTTKFPSGTVAPLTIGNQNINGQFAYAQLVPYAVTLNDIDSYKQATSDTRGEPYLPSESIFSTFRFGCPNGIFCLSTTTAPYNPLKRWATPYA